MRQDNWRACQISASWTTPQSFRQSGQGWARNCMSKKFQGVPNFENHYHKNLFSKLYLTQDNELIPTSYKET